MDCNPTWLGLYRAMVSEVATVLARRVMASSEQRRLMKEFYDHTGFEFMYGDEVRAQDREGFANLWEYNCNWLEDVMEETRRMIYDYENQGGS